MNYKFIIIPILATSLISCTGSKKSTSMPVDTGHVTPTETKAKQESSENKKQFANGDTCKHCDYIYRAQDQQGNAIESEMVLGYKNGEEREYRNGKLFRTSYYVEGGKNGMEYTFSNGKIVDSVYTETTAGGKWSFAELQKAIPKPIFNHLLDILFDEPSDVFAFTTLNGKIATIYKKDNSTITGEIPIVATIDYENSDDFYNFKLTVKKPFYEEMTYKDNDLVYRKIIKDSHTILEFKKGEFLKEYYDSGAIKNILKGDFAYYVDNDGDEYTGTFLFQEFFENGTLMNEYVYEDDILKKYKNWNDQNKLIFIGDFPTKATWFYDNGALKMEWKGEITEDIKIINGTSILFLPNGTRFEEEYKNGKTIHKKIYDENKKLQMELEGDFRKKNDNTSTLSNGIVKKWRTNGTLEQKDTFKNDTIVAQQLWDSTGCLVFDYERSKYVKWINNTTPKTRIELIGNITVENDDLSTTGNIIERGYKDEKMVYEHYNEEYMPFLKTYKSTIEYTYDSTGQKTQEKTTHLGLTASQKKWSKDSLSNEYFLSLDYNAKSYLKIYSEPQKLQMSFKGTSEWTDQLPTYIDGTVTFYFANGKTKSTTTLKDRNVISGKRWTENGFLYLDFVADKSLKFFSEDTKKMTMHFKGKSLIRNNAFDFIDGIANYYDETGKLTKKETYKNGQKIPDDSGNP